MSFELMFQYLTKEVGIPKMEHQNFKKHLRYAAMKAVTLSLPAKKQMQVGHTDILGWNECVVEAEKKAKEFFDGAENV